ncbi:MAG: DUF86 domain-containing protein, partial [Bdellovibrionales bacterium]
MKSDLHKSAVVRELEAIGEAAKFISEETKLKFPDIPWAQIVGMRNKLIHEYFNVDDSIVWEVAKTQLPAMETKLERAFLETAPPVHPWGNCPSGYYFVSEYLRRTHDATTSVRSHCRRNPSGKDQLYPEEIFLISKSTLDKIAKVQIGLLQQPPNANDF